MQTRPHPHRGFTIVELMIVVAIIGLLMALLLPALSSALRNSHAAHDKIVLKGVGMATTNSAEEYDDRFIRPSLVARGEFKFKSRNYGYVAGKGTEGKAWDSSESLYSVLIMMRYLSPETVVSPVDNNPMVGVKGEVEEFGANGDVVPYDYSKFDPGTAYETVTTSPDGFWDTAFFCQLDDDEADMASYANQTLAGRRYKKWMGLSRTIHPMYSTRGLSNAHTRGDEGEVTDPGHLYDHELYSATSRAGDGFILSPVLEQLGPLDTWNGHMYTTDGTVSPVDNFIEFKHYTTGLEDGGSYSKPLPDDMFMCEFTQEWVSDQASEGGQGTPYGFGASDNFLSYTHNGNADAYADDSYGAGDKMCQWNSGAGMWQYGNDDWFLKNRLTFDPLPE